MVARTPADATATFRHPDGDAAAPFPQVTEPMIAAAFDAPRAEGESRVR
jgi:hypothetical protein